MKGCILFACEGHAQGSVKLPRTAEALSGARMRGIAVTAGHFILDHVEAVMEVKPIIPTNINADMR
jgi:hypothetical protein